MNFYRQWLVAHPLKDISVLFETANVLHDNLYDPVGIWYHKRREDADRTVHMYPTAEKDTGRLTAKYG